MIVIELAPECWLRLEDNSDVNELPWECHYDAAPYNSALYLYDKTPDNLAQFHRPASLEQRNDELTNANRAQSRYVQTPFNHGPANTGQCHDGPNIYGQMSANHVPANPSQCHGGPNLYGQVPTNHGPANPSQCYDGPTRVNPAQHYDSPINLVQALYFSDPENLARIRLEGSAAWKNLLDGLTLASARWYQKYLRERERQRLRNMASGVRTVRDVIPHSRLATYGNFEYDEERESQYAMCVNLPSSLDAAYISRRGEEGEEIWMSPIVDKLMHIYLNPGDRTSALSQEKDQDPVSVLNPRLYSVDNSQHFELELKVMATKQVWSRDALMYQESYPPVFDQPCPVLKPFSGYVADNPIMAQPANPRLSSIPSSYPLFDVNLSSCASNQSSSGSSTSSCPSLSPLHPVYQQQAVAKPMWSPSNAYHHHHHHQMGSPGVEDFSLEAADLSKFLLFTLDLETEDCMKQTMEVASTWLNQVYPAKHAQKLEVNKQLLTSYSLSVTKGAAGPKKSLFSTPGEVISEFPPVLVPPPFLTHMLAPTQVKSSPLTNVPVSSPVEVLTVVPGSLTMSRRLSLPLSFSAVTKGACTKDTQDISEPVDTMPIPDKPLACATRKSRSKHRPPHPTPTRPSGVYTTLSGYKYYSPPRGCSEDKDHKTREI